MTIITLSLPYPPSANSYWRSRMVKARSGIDFVSTYVSEEAKKYKTIVQKIAMVSGIRKPIFGRVQIEIKLYPNRPLDWQKRMRRDGAAWDDTVLCIDLDNANKVLLDALKNIVIDDDKWVRKLSSERMEPDGEARVVVTITPIQLEQPQVALFP